MLPRPWVTLARWELLVSRMQCHKCHTIDYQKHINDVAEIQLYAMMPNMQWLKQLDIFFTVSW